MKNIFNSTLNWVRVNWRGILSAVILISLTLVILGTQFNSLIAGQNKYETATINAIQPNPEPWHRSVNAPYLLPAHYLGNLLNNDLMATRLISVIFGLMSVACFFFLLKLWFNNRIAVVGSLLFLASSWFLQLSHQAIPLILMVFTLLAIFTTLAWFLRTKQNKNIAFILFAASLGLAAYVPYMPWVIAIVLIVLLLKERQELLKLKLWVILFAAALYFIILTPFFVSLTGHPGQIKEFMGIPSVWPSLTGYFSNFYHLLLAISILAMPLPELYLNRLPLLDIFSSTMFLLGIYYFSKRLPKRRSLIILISIVVLIAVIALNPNYQLFIAAILPLVFMCIIAGVVELLNQWFSYFPRNPLARNLGVAIVVIAIGFSCFYHLQKYFVVWPNSPATKSVYVVKSK